MLESTVEMFAIIFTELLLLSLSNETCVWNEIYLSFTEFKTWVLFCDTSENHIYLQGLFKKKNTSWRRESLILEHQAPSVY